MRVQDNDDKGDDYDYPEHRYEHFYIVRSLVCYWQRVDLLMRKQCHHGNRMQ